MTVHESGDDYIRRIAAYIRANEKNLAEGGFARRRRTKRPEPTAGSALNPLNWFGGNAGSTNAAPAAPAVKPAVFTTDTNRLFYLLMRLEAAGFEVGSLDVQVENPSRPMSYINLFPDEKSDALSLSSIATSLSGISKLSLGGSWWGSAAPPPVDAELKFIFTSFTMLPALSLHAPGPKMVAEMVKEAPNALPLQAFRTLEKLEIIDVDPRTLLGWDKLSESLWSLKMSKTGVEDMSDVFISAVLDDQARREGRGTTRRRRIGRTASFYSSTQLPDAVEEEAEDVVSTPTVEKPETPTRKLPPLKWSLLRHLSLADNALTFLPTAPLANFSSVTHLDLSSNLLVSIPPGLSDLSSLVSLDLSDNMIDSVLGIYTQLGSVLYLKLSYNRLESLCGLERLMALERVDVRNNAIEESAEVGRLAALPNIAEVWVEGNPLTEIEEGYRVRVFTHFWKEDKEILLDGSPAGYSERRYRAPAPPEQIRTPVVVPPAPSPPVVAVGAASPHQSMRSGPSPKISPMSSATPSPHLNAVGVSKAKRKKTKRIVDLNGSPAESAEERSRSASRHARIVSDAGPSAKLVPPLRAARGPDVSAFGTTNLSTSPSSGILAGKLEDELTPKVEAPAPPARSPPQADRRARHSRHMTEFSPGASTPPTPPESRPSTSSLSSFGSPRRSATLKSSTLGKAKTRRGRVASVFEPSAGGEDEDEGGPEDVARRQQRDAEAYRARIEALRSEVGDGWLKVFSQSGMGTPSPPLGGKAAGSVQG